MNVHFGAVMGKYIVQYICVPRQWQPLHLALHWPPCRPVLRTAAPTFDLPDLSLPTSQWSRAPDGLQSFLPPPCYVFHSSLPATNAFPTVTCLFRERFRCHSFQPRSRQSAVCRKQNPYPIQSTSSMQHYECVALSKDISLQRGRFCTRSLASCIPRSSEDRSSWMFFIQVVHGCHCQFSGGGSKMAWLASAFSSIRARCPRKVTRRDWRTLMDVTNFLRVWCPSCHLIINVQGKWKQGKSIIVEKKVNQKKATEINTYVLF